MIEEILKLTNADPSKHFDKLYDKSEEHLRKTLLILRKWSASGETITKSL